MDDLTFAHMPVKATSAQITLRAVDSHSKRIRELDRSINLDILNNTFIIGRASKVESKGYIAAKGNAWYDNAVMSRRHAEIRAHFSDKRLEIKDLQSLHGTFLQSSLQIKPQTLNPAQPYQIMNGDELQFGVPVHRSEDRFEPVSLVVGMKWSGDPSPTFQVPDGSDDGSDMEDNFIDLTKVSSGTLPANTHTNMRCVIDLSRLSSSPPSPSSVKQYDDEHDYESGSEGSDTPPHPSTEPPQSFPSAPCFVSRDFSTSMPQSQDPCTVLGPVHNSDIDGHDASEIDLTSDDDDGESTDLDAVNDASISDTDSENGFDYDREDDDELGMNDPELDDIDWMDDDVYDDGEVHNGEIQDGKAHGEVLGGEAHDGAARDGKVLDDKIDTDNDSDCGFWAPRPEDRLSITRILNGETETRAHHQSSTIQSRMSVILPELSSDRAAPADLEVNNTNNAVGGQKHSSSVHTLCNTPRHHYIDLEHANPCYPPVHDQAVHRTTDHAAPPTTDVGYPPAHQSSDFSVSEPVSATSIGNMAKMMAAQTDTYRARRGWPPGSLPPYWLPECPSPKRTHVGIRDIVEPFEVPQKSGSKRKVDEISTLNPEESAWAPTQVTENNKAFAPMSPALSDPSPSKETMTIIVDTSSDTGVQTEVAESKQTPAQVAALSEGTSSVSAVEDSSSQRPAKRQRMRDIAERVGYAALGGVTAGAMIVGTLIYTAPTFA